MSNVIHIQPEGPRPEQLSELAKVRIPPRFHRERLGTYNPVTESQVLALGSVWLWLDAARKGRGPMLALVGKQGTGKSHLLYGAAHDLLADGGAAYIRSWYAFADLLRYGTVIHTEAGGRETTPAMIRADWWEAPIVLLDEVRPTSGTSFDDSELARFACHAYDHRRAVLLTTNVNPLEEVLGPAAASRFRQIVIEGPDARQESVA